jgi:hypothetical protein
MEKRCYQGGLGHGLVGHVRIDHPVGHRRRGNERHGAEGATEGLLVPLPGSWGLGWWLLQWATPTYYTRGL